MSSVSNSPSSPRAGGWSRYFIEHREVAWMALVAMLIWGWVSYVSLPQQEDPTIPERKALLVTYFPGATAQQVEQLVTRKLEKKITEMNTIDEISSESRAGVSVITVSLQSASKAKIDQEWDKMRAKMGEVALPHGVSSPFLDTDFGNTITLLYALTSPTVPEAVHLARAKLIRAQLESIHAKTGKTGRAAIVGIFPPSISEQYRREIVARFQEFLMREGIGKDLVSYQSPSFSLCDFAIRTGRDDLERAVRRFTRDFAGTDGELHPDFGLPLVLIEGEDPLPQLRAKATPFYNYRELDILAEKLEDQLKQLPGTGKVRRIGSVSEQIDLLFSIPNVAGRNLTAMQAMQAIAARNELIPGGTLRAEGHNFPVKLTGEFKSEQDLLGAVVGLSREGMPMYLRDVFEVRRGYENPIPYNVSVLQRDGPKGELAERRSVLLAIEMKEGNNIRDFGHEVSKVINQFKSRLPEGIEISKLSDQPTAVSGRIHQFVKCFVEAVLIVVVVSVFLMDWRSALVLAAAIPLTVAITLGAMQLIGIPLHQVSIASLIIALGMLVDVPVICADAINRELALGQPRAAAAWLGPLRLKRPMLFATLINMVAFLPLALLPGDKGAFIMALPIVVSLALVAAQIVAVTFTPLIGYYLLRGQKGLDSGAEVRPFFLFKPVDLAIGALLPRYRGLLHTALRHPLLTLVIAYGLLGLSFGIVPYLGTQFFPPAERNQCLIDIELPQADSLARMRKVCAEVVDVLKKQPEIVNAGVFMGGSSPRFYYNVVPKEPASYLAQVLINTRTADEVGVLLPRLRAELDRRIAGARVVVKTLEQGVPVEAPIQIRLSGDDLDSLRTKADEISAILRQAGAYHVSDDLGQKMPALEVDIDQERANTLGVDNSKVGQMMQAAFAGLKVTELRQGDRLVPVVVRLDVNERNDADKIRSLYVETHHGQPVPLDSFATVRLSPEYARIGHFSLLRTVTVSAYSVVGELPSQVLARVRPAIDRISLPSGCHLEYAGEAKELKKNQDEMGLVMKVSLALIALALVFQFNSVVKSVVVMLTVPLGLIGGFVGLLLMRGSLGFMALLAIVSLAGVIVSHIIVLSDYIEEARAEGLPLVEALVHAGLVRLRPVLVTVLATVGGLLPLAIIGGELWHPLTAVHIFGLLLATALTLIVLPVLYYVFCAKLKWIK